MLHIYTAFLNSSPPRGPSVLLSETIAKMPLPFGRMKFDFNLIDAPRAFSLLNEGQVKQLTSPICMASWNPKMDLVAIVSEDQRLGLYRLDWQRVWSLASSVKVTAICWRPDGKVLVTGCDDGSMFHYSVERGEVILRWNAASTGGNAIIQLTWLDGKEEAVEPDHLQRRHSSLLPRPAAQVPKTPSTIDDLSTTATVTERTWPPHPANYNILLSLDKAGAVCLYESGRFELISINVDIRREGTLSASVSQDLNALVLTFLPTDQRSVFASIFSLESIHSLKMHGLSILLLDAQDSLKGAQLGMSACLKEWSAAQKELQARVVTSLAQTLRDNSSADTSMMEGEESDWQEDEDLVEGELTSLLATGNASPGMRAFLASTLGEHNLKRLAKATDTALESVHSILIDMVKPSLESVAFILGDVKGTAGDVGLSVKELNEAEFQLALALLQCQALREFVESYQLSLRTLFGWLLKVWHQQENGMQSAYDSVAIEARQIPQVLSLFTEHLLTDDMILPDLKESNTIGARAASLETFFTESNKDAREMMELMFSKAIQDWPRLPLRRLIDSFSVHFTRMLSGLSDSLSSQIKPQHLPLGEGAILCSHSTSVNENNPSSVQLLVAFEHRIVVYSVKLFRGEAFLETSMEMTSDLIIPHSVSFYRDGLILTSCSSDDASKPTSQLLYVPRLDSSTIKVRSFHLPQFSRVLLAISNTRGTGLFSFQSSGSEKEDAGAWLLDLEEDEDVSD